MSGTPDKRSHDEGGSGVTAGSHGHSSASKYQHDDSGAYAKVTPSVPREYHASYDMGQDARLQKNPRTQMFRVSSSSSDPHSDHPMGSELRDPKDANKDVKIEIRDAKLESREYYQGNTKGERDARFESRADDPKEAKYERDMYPEYKSEMKVDKDSHVGGSSHINWKDSKEQHRVRRYPDSSAGNLDLWHGPRINMHGSCDVGKEGSTAEDRDHPEVREAVGENKIDLKGDDKLKDKDRKRKEAKHREWGERERDRNDRRANIQLGNSGSENKESLKEERESERWEKERRDPLKDKEKLKEREKDYVKREPWSASEKEGTINEKEQVDISGRATEHENMASEQKKQKELDSWKNADNEARGRRKERDGDVEGERPDKRNRYNDKEPEEGGMDAEGVAERDREAFNCVVQQRKRMLRSRGSPQVANRDSRSKSRGHDDEGSQGKPDVFAVTYKVGECMQELVKMWKEHEALQAEKMSESTQLGPTLEIRIPAEHVTATNRQVRGGQLWGTEIYTNDSDLVAVLMHTGYCRPTASPPPPNVQELRATVRVLPPQDCYISTLRNNVRSRAWGAAIGCSYRVERCCIVKKGSGGTVDLEPCLTHSSTVEPTLAPVTVERTMTTRAAASNALRQQRFVREVTIQFNLCHEPWLKYSISAVADKGLKKPVFTSSRLKKGEVLYLETHSCRYELCYNGERMVKAAPASHAHEAEIEKSQPRNSHIGNDERSVADGESFMTDLFRWSRCKKPLSQKRMRSIGIPLPIEHVEVLEENLDWNQIDWSQTGVCIAGKEYPLARVHFLSPN